MRWIWQLGLAALTMIAATGSAGAGGTDVPPYRMRDLPHLHLPENLGTERPWIEGDVDGDGDHELVMKTPTGLIGIDWIDGGPTVGFQFNLPPKTIIDPRSPRLGAALDLDGDGRDEFAYTLADPESDAWRLQIYAPSTGTLTLDRRLPTGPDTRADGRFDGDWRVAGTLPGRAPSGGPLLLLVSVVRFDLVGRGVAGFDARNGEFAWRLDTGPNPVASTLRTIDLDGDGHPEILFAANSPDNLGDLRIDGLGDDQAWIFALDDGGRTLWRRSVGGAFCTPGLEVADLDGDLRPEVILTTAHHGTDPDSVDRLRVLDARDGRVRAEIPLPGGCRQPLVLPATDSERPEILVGRGSRRLGAYVFENETLTLARTAPDDLLIEVFGVHDILPSTGPEIVALRDPRTDAVRLQILDPDFRTLAEYPLQRPDVHLATHLWSPEPRTSILLTAGASGRHGLVCDGRNLSPGGWTWRAPIAVAAAGLIALAVPGFRRLRSRRSRHRDRLRRLLHDLEESSHGTLAATRGVERLVWLIRARRDDASDDSPLGARLSDGLEDFREIVAPKLASILELAARSGLDRARTESLKRSLQTFADRIATLDLDQPSLGLETEAPSDLDRTASETVDGFRRLRHEAEARFSTDPVVLARRLISLRDDGRIEFKLDVAAPETDLAVCIDAADLRFVLENLIDNAVRAMQDSEPAALTIRIERRGDRIEMSVTDTGPGIDPALAERIFEPGASTRADGGLGLSRAREILRPWRGRLDLLDHAAPGARFGLSLRARHRHTDQDT